jgi:hypothetical protein
VSPGARTGSPERSCGLGGRLRIHGTSPSKCVDVEPEAVAEPMHLGARRSERAGDATDVAGVVTEEHAQLLAAGQAFTSSRRLVGSSGSGSHAGWQVVEVDDV